MEKRRTNSNENPEDLVELVSGASRHGGMPKERGEGANEWGLRFHFYTKE